MLEQLVPEYIPSERLRAPDGVIRSVKPLAVMAGALRSDEAAAKHAV